MFFFSFFLSLLLCLILNIVLLKVLIHVQPAAQEHQPMRKAVKLAWVIDLYFYFHLLLLWLFNISANIKKHTKSHRHLDGTFNKSRSVTRLPIQGYSCILQLAMGGYVLLNQCINRFNNRLVKNKSKKSIVTIAFT